MKKLIRITSVPLSMEKLIGNQLTYMNQFFEVTAVSSNEQQLKIVADQLGVKHHTVEMTRRITPFKDLQSIYRMYRFFLKTKPDIVHSHTPKAGLVGMVAAYFAHVPTRLHTVAGLPLLESKGVKRKILSMVETFTYSFCTKVYPNSLELQKIILKEKFCKESKLKVLGNGSSNGIDLSHFDPNEVTPEEKATLKKKLSISDEDFVFIFLGRVVKDKGINELVSAFKSMLEEAKEVLENSTDIELINEAQVLPFDNVIPRVSARPQPKGTVKFYTGSSISGLGLRKKMGKVLYNTNATIITKSYTKYKHGKADDITPNSKNKVSQRTVYPNVKLLLVGSLEQKLNPILGMTLTEIQKNKQIVSVAYVQDVRPYLAISNCLVFPSYREGFPNVVLQAGAMGLPSIVTNINGCNEIIEDQSNGLIIPAKDAKALCAAMIEVMNNATLLQKLQRHTRQTIVSKYCQKEIWQALLAEYEEATGN